MKYRGSRRKQALVTPESKLLFVIRIQGWVVNVIFAIIFLYLCYFFLWFPFSPLIFRKNDMHPKTRKILYSLRLRKIFSGVFVKANDRIMQILQKVEPFITYGYDKLISTSGICYKLPIVNAFIGRILIPLTANFILLFWLLQYYTPKWYISHSSSHGLSYDVPCSIYFPS